MPRPPVYEPLTIRQGTTWQHRWPITHPDTSDPVDLSDWSAHGQIRKWHGATEVLHEWNSTTDSLTLGADGYVTITVPHSISTAWTWTDGVYDIALTSPDDKVVHIATGPVQVAPQITR